ncbi:hypothetical protein JCM3774_005473 [Rhodotorula dairenensis]
MDSAAYFRSLVFHGTVPVHVQLAPQDLPPTADRSLLSCYLQAPRISYLALSLDDIKRDLVELVLDHAALERLDDNDLWFETCTEPAIPLRWHWPLGLLYDLHYTAQQIALLPPRPVTIPSSLASVFAAPSSSSSSAASSSSSSVFDSREPDLSLSIGGGGRRASQLSTSATTLRAPTTTTSKPGLAPGSRNRVPSAPPHQSSSSTSAPLMNRTRSAAAAATSTTATSSPSASPAPAFRQSTTTSGSDRGRMNGHGHGHEIGMATRPWRIRLRIRNAAGAIAQSPAAGAPATTTSTTSAQAHAGGVEVAALLGLNTAAGGGNRVRIDEIRTGFMALIKEADYVRWGSTKRVMNLPKEQQDNLWDAVVHTPPRLASRNSLFVFG